MKGIIEMEPCTSSSCIYRNYAQQLPCLNRIRYNSKIDKLYRGKFIPLRECRLVDALESTRAEYDNIDEYDDGPCAHYIMSETSTTRPQKAKKSKKKSTDSSEVERSCNCSICSLKARRYKQNNKKFQRNRRGMSHYSIFKDKETHNYGRKRFKPKSIKSEPCRCTNKLFEESGDFSKLNFGGAREMLQHSVHRIHRSRDAVGDMNDEYDKDMPQYAGSCPCCDEHTFYDDLEEKQMVDYWKLGKNNISSSIICLCNKATSPKNNLRKSQKVTLLHTLNQKEKDVGTSMKDNMALETSEKKRKDEKQSTPTTANYTEVSTATEKNNISKHTKRKDKSSSIICFCDKTTSSKNYLKKSQKETLLHTPNQKAEDVGTAIKHVALETPKKMNKPKTRDALTQSKVKSSNAAGDMNDTRIKEMERKEMLQNISLCPCSKQILIKMNKDSGTKFYDDLAKNPSLKYWDFKPEYTEGISIPKEYMENMNEAKINYKVLPKPKLFKHNYKKKRIRSDVQSSSKTVTNDPFKPKVTQKRDKRDNIKSSSPFCFCDKATYSKESLKNAAKRSSKPGRPLVKKPKERHLELKRCFCELKFKPMVNKSKSKLSSRFTSSFSSKTEQIKSVQLREYKSQNTSIKNALKRCLCSLKFDKNHDIRSTEPINMENTLMNDKGRTINTKYGKVLEYNEWDPCVCLESNKLSRHNISVSTIDPKMVSVSSAVDDKNLRHVHVQSRPSFKTKKSKLKYPLQPRNSIKLGASFSFSIEFYKEDDENSKYTENDSDKIIPNKNFNHKDIKPIEFTDKVTQISLEKKSLIDTVVKRCFCTLPKRRRNFHNHGFLKNSLYSPFPTSVYIVNRVATTNIPNLQSAIRSFKKTQINLPNCENWKSLLPEYITESNHLSVICDTDTDKEKVSGENYSLSSELSSKLFSVDERLKTSSLKTSSYPTGHFFSAYGRRNLKLVRSNYNSTYVSDSCNCRFMTKVSQYLKDCYCNMNFETIYDKTQNSTTKLKPYECEPGICEPGHCNPYECKKLILKRLQSQQSKQTGPELQKFVSKSTMSLEPTLASHKTQSRPSKVINYKHIPIEKCKTNAVCIASNFSFSIEFCKDKPHEFHESSIKDVEPLKKKEQKMLRTSSANGRDVVVRNKMVQEKILMTSKASYTAPVKRCFCTLKLQKRGYLNDSTQVNLKPVIRYISRHQNTNKQKRLKTKMHNLAPYEYVPNIRVPKYCDPYKCLELLSKRNCGTNNVGTITIYKNKCVSTCKRTGQCKRTSHATNVSRKFNIRNVEPIKNWKPSSSALRQCVRFGSNFSFSIEFSKENCLPKGHLPGTRYNKVKSVPSREYISKTVHTGTSSPQPNLIDAKTEDTNEKNEHSLNTNSFLKRCYSLLKLLHQQKHKIKPLPIKTKSIAVMTAKKNKLSALYREYGTVTSPIKFKKPIYSFHPYECEPFTCVPGQCYPLECFERYKTRNIRRKHIGLETNKQQNELSSTKCEDFPCKNRKMQTITFKGVDTQRRIKQKVRKVRKGIPRNRQGVRIGSNFSFNIEFYRHNCKKDFAPRKTVATYKKIRSANKKIQYIDSTIATRGVMSDVTPVLKRCFCTLKLQENIKDTAEKGQMTPKKMQIKKIETLAQGNQTENKYFPKKVLLPYEYEPNIGIPGLCSPHQCYELMKRSLYKDSNVATVKNIQKHFSTNTVPTIISQSLKTQSLRETNRTIKPIKSRKKRTRNVVIIRSNFGFHIEFCKNRDTRPFCEDYADNNNNNKVVKRPISKIKSFQFDGCHGVDRASQCYNHTMRSQSFLTKGMWQRCFFTKNIFKSHHLQYVTNTVLVNNRKKLQEYSAYSHKTDIRRTNCINYVISKDLRLNYHQFGSVSKIDTKIENRFIFPNVFAKVTNKIRSYLSFNLESFKRNECSSFATFRNYLNWISKKKIVSAREIQSYKHTLPVKTESIKHSDSKNIYAQGDSVKICNVNGCIALKRCCSSMNIKQSFQNNKKPKIADSVLCTSFPKRIESNVKSLSKAELYLTNSNRKAKLNNYKDIDVASKYNVYNHDKKTRKFFKHKDNFSYKLQFTDETDMKKEIRNAFNVLRKILRCFIPNRIKTSKLNNTISNIHLSKNLRLNLKTKN